MSEARQISERDRWKTEVSSGLQGRETVRAIGTDSLELL